MTNPDWDVIVIGCGPVGAFAANLFGRAGLRTLVLERDLAPYALPRAVHVDHEILRLLQDVRLLETLKGRLLEGDGHLHVGADHGVIRYLSAAGKPRPYGYANDYFFYQPELEQVLRDGLRRFEHVTLRLGAEVVGVLNDGKWPRISLADGSWEVARWVVAADGARSTVRNAVNVVLDDLGFEEPWLVVDAEVDGPLRFPDLSGVPRDANLQALSVMMCDPHRPATVVPGRGHHRRWEFMLLPGESDLRMAELETVRGLIAPWVGEAPYRLIRAATYRFHALVAKEWTRGAVFLAGDAAHQTPPFFGQGMCHGMRDVANLAWKLSLVTARAAGPKLLDTYQAERDPQVRHVIARAIEAGRYICLLDPAAAAERDGRIRATPDIESAADLIVPIRSRIIDAAAGQRFINPLVGEDRRLLDDVTGGGWVLLSRGPMPLSPSAEAVLGALSCRQLQIGQDVDDSQAHLSQWLEAAGANAVWLRPDFYVAATAVDADGLSWAIEEIGAAMELVVSESATASAS